jgi:hypothetical protein
MAGLPKPIERLEHPLAMRVDSVRLEFEDFGPDRKPGFRRPSVPTSEKIGKIRKLFRFHRGRSFVDSL